MGWRQRVRTRRTALAALLTAVAVAVPCGALYIVGGHQVARTARLKEESVYGHGKKVGLAVANRLAAHFERLRAGESRRAFYLYQNPYHDPQGAAEGLSVSRSPLAEGPADPLILAHFQVDEAGRITLPTLNDRFPELAMADVDETQCGLLSALEDVAFFCTGDGIDNGASGGFRACPTLARESLAPPVHAREVPAVVVERLEARAWQQHLAASALYADLKYHRKGTSDHAAAVVGRTPVEVVVGPFDWYTLPVAGRPGLVALRVVDTPVGRWMQGFAIDRTAVRSYLRETSFPVSFLPAESLGERLPDTVVLPVEGTTWGLRLDLGARLAETRIENTEAWRRFLRLWLLCLLAAGVAGVLVVGMVYQSERLAAQRAQFAASAAHELRTPIAGLRLYSEMLAEGLGDPGRARDYARRVAGEAERLGRVVTNVLSFTHLERQTLAVSPRSGDLAAAVRDALERHAPALEQAGAQLEVDLPTELPAVRFDRDALGHILQNLLDNAEKYTRGVEDRRIFVALRATARAVALSVADNGRGISTALRRRLFRPFARGGTGPEAPEGLGLGLVLVRALALAQGGDIRYSDAPSGGAVFTVTFPR